MDGEGPMQPLRGKAAIVTGGARGIGRGVALAFVKAGAKVMIVDREEALGRETEAQLQAIGEAMFRPADLSRHAELPAIVEEAVGRFGRLGTLVNVAQASRQKLLLDTTIADAAVSFDTGFWPTFVLMQAAHPHLARSKGSVINFGTGAAFLAPPTQGSYAAAKEAIRAISKVAATEWGPDGIRVNVVCPFASSPGVQAWSQDDPEAFAQLLRSVPLGRIGDCEEDIGAAVIFLASDAARYITGQTLMVDGGQTRTI